jgi:hypothetical protein
VYVWPAAARNLQEASRGFMKSLIILSLVCAMSKYVATVTARRLLDVNSMSKLLGFVHDEFNLKPEYFSSFVPFTIHGKNVGLVTKEFASHLISNYQCFDNRDGSKQLCFTQALERATLDEKTKALQEVNVNLREKGMIPGWRDEMLPLSSTFNSDPVLLIERAACSVYGVKAYGVHVNGFIRDQSSKQITHLWVAKRAKNKATWPGMLDHIVAGGLPFGISLRDNVIKECEEEASISRELAENAIPTGAVSYCSLDEAGNIRRDCLFCYDLELPPNFVPTPNDDEVECFELKEVAYVLDKVIEGAGDGGRTGYKPNCNLVLIDFFIRHGIIDPESPMYLQLLDSLRSGSCS